MNIILVLILAALAIFSRLISHAPNFTPVISVALFAGAYVKNRGVAMLAVLGMLLASDAVIGFYSFDLMAFVYFAVLFITTLGFMLKDNVKVGGVIGYSFIGALIFFIVTNFGVWAVPNSSYPHTLAGLTECFILALPFFRNTLASTLFYSIVMFGGYELVVMIARPRARAA